MSRGVTADDVLARASADLPEGCIVTSAVVVVEYLLPGEEDEDERGPFLTFRRDTTSGIWKHLGMLESVSNDFRADLREQE